ncbi:MAG: glycosyltransferase [Hydrogenophilales bacterium]|nr:glycosyltransferase [Hydrogenophilales bacterium]
MREGEAKEVEIRSPTAALTQHRSLESRGPDLADGPPGQGEPDSAPDARRIQSQLEQFERLIQQQKLALAAYRFFTPVIRPINYLALRTASLLRLRGSLSSVRQISDVDNAESDAQRRQLINARIGEANRPASVLESGEPDRVAQLIEKERVILEQRRALAAYREFFFLFAPIIRLLNFVLVHDYHGLRRPLGFLVRQIQVAFSPRLGRLTHYPPREAAWPAEYRAAPRSGTQPSVSLITPSFNQGAFIERTMQSVLAQGYPHLEYYVQDGGSTDETVAVLRRYEGRLTGWASASDGGQSQAINLGFARTSGEIMAWLNSDDLLLPGRWPTWPDYFARHPEVEVVYGHRILIDEDDQEIGRWILPGHDDGVLSWADFIPQETLFWRRSLWEKAGGRVDESYRFAMDWDLLLRFRAAGARMVRLPRFLGAFRVHGAQKTSAVIADVGFGEMDRLRQRELGREVSRAEIGRGIRRYVLAHIYHDAMYRTVGRLA